MTYWDLASDAHRRSLSIVEAAERPVSERLIELAGIRPGDTVLDVATGIGEPALTVASRVGASGRVIAVDAAPTLLAVAASRAHDAGFSNVEVRQADANVLDLSGERVNAIVCRWGLMFLDNLADALGRMRRLLVPGGRLAAATWSTPDRVPFITVRRKVIRDFDLPGGALNPFSLSSESALRAAASAAGFDDVRTERMNVGYEFRSPEAYADFQRSMHEHRIEGLRQRLPEQQEEFWAAVAEEARRYADAHLIVRMPSEVLLLTARA